ncbi:HPr family phosphocarrier protein [Tessaracoccus rhinocerotis]|uniref:Phosphocarrier protein HPr n=1 Tax=Tessaracoccus rhinocerotis TaxID=1689449 RepID=A0A553K1T3_9ACTN|nr:HPr family phosphocarrier protein [Tessaracoccus rhinocerotis]TRY18668.1 HPr family phosphocarrier protein [Tessaracoccus rhinocerotis]
MASRNVVVGSAVGLHARPAALIAAAAAEYDDDITIRRAESDPGKGVDAGSSMMIMTLGAKQGAEVVVESDNEAAVNEIAALIEQDLDA